MSLSDKQNNKKYSRFKSLDEFTILEVIGKGGYSKVYLVEHKRTKRKYALKAADKMKNGKDRGSRTMMEIRVLRKLKHPNIIRLKGYFFDDDTIYLVLEHIPGKDCSKFFKSSLPSRDQVKMIIIQLVEVLMFCHKKGVIHRDVKLENILIDEHFNIKLIDFGLCAVKENEFDMLNDHLGTMRYIAPEMLSGGEGYNDSVDIWAIGVILFMLLTGSYPYDGSSKENIFRRIKEKTIHYSKYNLERNDVKLLRSLLEKNPEKRLEIEEILDHPFFN